MEGKDLRGQLYVDQVVVNSVELDKPQTVCTASNCVDHKRMGNTEVVKTIYRTVCHEDCNLQGVQVESIPNAALEGCSSMSNGVCKECGCHWQTHMHIKYRIEESVKQVIDPSVQESIKRRDNASDTINIFLEAEAKKMAELTEEHAHITQCCAEFAAFLSANSIMPYNDSYGQYIDHLIKEENDKIDAGGGSRLLDELKTMKIQYEEQVSLLRKAISSTSRSVKSVQEVDEMIASLSELKHSGSIIDEIRGIRLHQISKTTKSDSGKKIRVDGGLLVGAKKKLSKMLGTSK